MQQFLDSVALTGVKETAEGYLIADAFTVRTGVQRYAGYEVGRPELASVNVYRSEAEVFHKDSVRSFSHVPVTDDHPKEAVTSANWGDLAVGETSTDVMRDGERLRIPLILKDKATIDKVRAGKRELSAGYGCELVFEDGVAPDGTAYQAVQKNIRANHIAVVDRGRAGKEFRIGDSAAHWGAAPLAVTDREIPNMRKILLDGITIETTDQGVEAIEKLQKQLGDSTANITKLTADHAAVVAGKDEKIGTLTAELADAKGKLPTGAALDKLVADRVALLDAAKAVVTDKDFTGVNDADVRKAVVIAKLGDDVVKDASEAEILGMFKAVTKDAKTAPAADPFRQVMQNRDGKTVELGDNGQAAYEKRLSDAWKSPVATA